MSALVTSVTFRGFKIGGSDRHARLRGITGLFSRALEANSPDLPRYHGSLVGARYDQSKRVEVSFAVAPEDRFAAMEAFKPLVDSEDELLVELSGLDPVVLFCRPVRADIPVDERAERGYAVGTVAFEASDPVLYSPDVTQATLVPFVSAEGVEYPITYPTSYGSGGSGGGTTISLDGSWETWPRFVIAKTSGDPLTNPIIENLTGGQRLALNANGGAILIAGQSLVIETHPARRSIRFATGASRYGKLSSDSRFFPLLPGDNVLRFRASGDTTGATVAVSARSARI